MSVKSPALPSRDHPELHYLSIIEASALIRRRRLSPVELTAAILRRIDALDGRLRAFITVCRDEASKAARRAERELSRGDWRGPLHGIPVGVKDTHYTRGIRTTAGSAVLADFIPSFDATVVARLKSAGAVLIGKTNLPEFSFGSDTPSSNPWNQSRPPGGSSGGSAVALAAGMLTGATGGDTSGSIRFPATFCGVVGMKPTFGRVSRHGVVPISWSLDHVGPMTRTVADNALMLSVMAGEDPLDPFSSDEPVPDYAKALKGSVRGMRIGIPRPDLLAGWHPDVVRAFQEALRIWKRLGARIREVDLPPILSAMDECQRVVRIAEAACYHEPFLMTRAERYAVDSADPNVRSPRRDVEAGWAVPAVHYLKAQRITRRFVSEMTAVFSGLDLFVTPERPAPAGEKARVRQEFARMFNCCGFPALALPAGFSTTPPGLPVGLQVAAGPFEEAKIYAAAWAYERETEWHRFRPEV